MRARNLKPGFFKNEVLGKADPLYGDLFQGLWCMADREGRLEDRPLRICAEIFPYRRKLTEKRVDEMLWWLDGNRFIARYQIGAELFIQVLEFLKHQNPHRSERTSIIQPFSPDLHRARPVESRKQHTRKQEAAGLTPSSLTPDSPFTDSPFTDSPFTDSCIPVQPPALARSEPGLNGHGLSTPDAEHDTGLQAIMAAYPKRSGRTDWATGAHYCRLLVDRGATWGELLEATHRYAAHCNATRATGSQHVLMPGNFFGASDQPWKTGDWTVPKVAKKSFDERLAALRDDAPTGEPR